MPWYNFVKKKDRARSGLVFIHEGVTDWRKKKQVLASWMRWCVSSVTLRNCIWKEVIFSFGRETNTQTHCVDFHCGFFIVCPAECVIFFENMKSMCKPWSYTRQCSHTLLNSTPDQGRLSASVPGLLLRSEKSPRHPLNRRLIGLRSRSGSSGDIRLIEGPRSCGMWPSVGRQDFFDFLLYRPTIGRSSDVVRSGRGSEFVT